MALEEQVAIGVGAATLAVVLFLVLRLRKIEKAALGPSEPLKSLESSVKNIEGSVGQLAQGIGELRSEVQQLSAPPPPPPPPPTLEGPTSGPPGLSGGLGGTVGGPTGAAGPEVGAINPGATYKYVWDPVTRKHKLVQST